MLSTFHRNACASAALASPSGIPSGASLGPSSRNLVLKRDRTVPSKLLGQQNPLRFEPLSSPSFLSFLPSFFPKASSRELDRNSRPLETLVGRIGMNHRGAGERRLVRASRISLELRALVIGAAIPSFWGKLISRRATRPAN